MSSQSQEELIKSIALEVIRTLKKEEKQRVKKAILDNTEVLLNKYYMLQDFIDELDYDCLFDDILYKSDSLKRKKINSAILLNHINKSVKKLFNIHPKQGKVIKLMYMRPWFSKLTWEKKINGLARHSKLLFGEKVSERTIYRWRTNMVDELSIILFGADGIKLIIVQGDL